MAEVPSFQEVVSEQSEASLLDDEKIADDIQSVKNLIEYGLPIDVNNAYNTTIDLGKITYDDFIPEQSIARTHIEAAIALFVLSYQTSVIYEVKEANRIITAHPGIILLEDNQVVIAITSSFPSDGPALLKFRTDLS